MKEGINYLLNNRNDDAEKLMLKMGNQFVKKAKEKTPKGTTKKNEKKRLTNTWKKTAVEGFIAEKQIKIYNNSPHFHLIERGHEIYDGKGKVTGKRTTPVYMAKRTAEEMQTEYPKEVKKYIEKLQKKVEKEIKKKC